MCKSMALPIQNLFKLLNKAALDKFNFFASALGMVGFAETFIACDLIFFIKC